VSGAATIAGAMTLSSTLALTSTTTNAGLTAVDVFASDGGFIGTVAKIRASRGSSFEYKLLSLENSGSSSVFSVRGDGLVTISGLWVFKVI
jgi:hypothetical protein